MTIPWLRLSARVAHFLGVALPEETDFEVGVEAWGRGDYHAARVNIVTLKDARLGSWQDSERMGRKEAGYSIYDHVELGVPSGI